MRFCAALCVAISFVALTGCQDYPEPPESFEPNYVYSIVLETVNDLDEGQMKQPLADTYVKLEEMFGTPDDPKIPAELLEGDYKDMLSLDLLKVAAGPAAEGKTPGKTGLYRQFCSNCHGETGQGRGTVAASQNPYPRDFRRGLFKYKSTPRNAKPTHGDLLRTVANGMPGTQMPFFKEQFSPDQIEAVTQYALYLSLRGELERRILSLIAEEEEYDASEVLTEIANEWVEADDQVVDFEPPDDIHVEGLTENVDPTKLAESIARGRQVFLNEAAACAKCHGESARGDGKQLPDYDDWTKEWTKQIQIDPADPQAIAPLQAMGAMKPQTMIVRNLLEGKFRGGREPLDIYRRIRYGIAGAPMPAASVVDSPDQPGITEADMWHLVNYVRSIAGTEAETPTNTATPAPKVAAN
jgi:mono/diheme cytochrome c family protein